MQDVKSKDFPLAHVSSSTRNFSTFQACGSENRTIEDFVVNAKDEEWKMSQDENRIYWGI